MKSYLYIYYFFFKKRGGKKTKRFFFFKEKSFKGAARKWLPQVPLERTVVRLSLGTSVCLQEGGGGKGWARLEGSWEKLGWHPRKMGEGASKVSNCEREVRVCVEERRGAQFKPLTRPSRPPVSLAPLLLRGIQAWT